MIGSLSQRLSEIGPETLGRVVLALAACAFLLLCSAYREYLQR